MQSRRVASSPAGRVASVLRAVCVADNDFLQVLDVVGPHDRQSDCGVNCGIRFVFCLLCEPRHALLQGLPEPLSPNVRICIKFSRTRCFLLLLAVRSTRLCGVRHPRGGLILMSLHEVHAIAPCADRTRWIGRRPTYISHHLRGPRPSCLVLPSL